MLSLKKPVIAAAIVALSIGLLPISNTEAAPVDEVMFVLDASSSMLATDGGSETRIERAKSALVSSIKSLPDNQRVGVRVYGSVIPDTDKTTSCQDSLLLSAPISGDRASIIGKVNDVQAKGWTLMARALNDVKSDFTGEGSKTVILLSDGVDTCDPAQTCEVAKNMTVAGTKISVNTLGLVVSDEARSQLQCIAQNSGGTYYDVNDLNRLQKALVSLTSKAVSLFDGEGTPVEGTADIQEAPALVSETLYTDVLSGDEVRYYGFDSLPKQKITVTVKAADNADALGMTNYLGVRGFVKQDGSRLSTTGIYGESERFNKGADIVTTVYSIDTEQQKIDKPQAIAFSVSVRGNKSDVPVQITIATEGGVAPNNKTIDEGAKANNLPVDDDVLPWWAILLPLALAMAGVILYSLHRRKKPNSQPRELTEANAEVTDTDEKQVQR
jgi:Mg-chelatase subunit ChlD